MRMKKTIKMRLHEKIPGLRQILRRMAANYSGKTRIKRMEIKV
jgi:hypothetical protein